MEIVVTTQSQAWVSAVRLLGSQPVVAPRGMRVREAEERMSLVITHPDRGFVQAEGRKFYHAITAIEGTSLVGQTSVPELLLDRVGSFAPYADDGIFWGAYGPRIAGDLGLVVELLKRDPDSRQAVLTIFSADRDLGRAVHDVPCTVAIQFFLRDAAFPAVPGDLHKDKRLHMWVVMRSNDAWLGLPYDLGQFSLLQMAVAQALDADIGHYTHSVGSMHLYERNWAEAALIGEPAPSGPSVRRFGADDISGIASRCRRILLGHPLNAGRAYSAPLTELESWLIRLISERDR